MAILDTIVEILSAYALFLVVFGTIGNFLVFLTSIRLRHTSTFIFMAFMAISDTLTLYFWNLNHFTSTFFNLDIENTLVINCRIGNFIQFSSFQSSSWLLVSI
jgi:hypothetical protein